MRGIMFKRLWIVASALWMAIWLFAIYVQVFQDGPRGTGLADILFLVSIGVLPAALWFIGRWIIEGPKREKPRVRILS